MEWHLTLKVNAVITKINFVTRSERLEPGTGLAVAAAPDMHKKSEQVEA